EVEPPQNDNDDVGVRLRDLPQRVHRGADAAYDVRPHGQFPNQGGPDIRVILDHQNTRHGGTVCHHVPMRRALPYVAPWAGVTALAVALSWLGVRGVVRDAVSERSSPPPAAGPVIRSSPPFPTSVGSPTSLPEPPAGEDSAPKPSPSPKVPPGGGDEPAKSSPSRKPRDNVRSYTTR